MDVEAPSPRLRFALCVLVALVASLPYLRAIDNPLLWDARSMVLDDPGIRSLANLPGFFTAPTVALEEEGVAQLVYWRPLARALVAVVYALSGEGAVGYNLANLALHAAGAVLLYLLVEGVSGKGRLALAAALLFAANPTHVEAVAWAYGLSTTLGGALSLGMLLAWHRGRRLLAGGLFVGALLTREDAAVLPAVVLLHEVLVRGDRRPVAVLPFVGVLGLWLGVRALVAGPPPVSPLPVVDWAHAGVTVLARYAKVLAWPDAPVAVYPLRDLGWIEIGVSWGVVAAGAIAFLALWRLRPPLAFWLGLGQLALAPWLNVGRFGEYLLTEKGAYVASAGFAVVVAAGLLRLAPRGGVAAAAIALHLAVSTGRAVHWDDPARYFAEAVAFAPTFATVRYNLGVELAERGAYAEAAEQFEAVARLSRGNSLALNNLGNCRWALGDADGAARAWTAALLADPGNGQAAFNLGMLAERRGDLAEAVRLYSRYLERTPEAPPELVARIRALARSWESGG